MSTVGTSVLDVDDGGFLTTVQDLGRFGHQDEGVPVAGACDEVGLAIANLVIGNPAGAAAIECTIIGPELVVRRDLVVGIGGADLGITAEPGGRHLEPGRSHRLAAGERLAFGRGPLDDGCRTYLALPGGVDVPEVLGSRSTSLVGAFGGLEGRLLRAGDAIGAIGAIGADGAGGSSGAPGPPDARWPGPQTPRPIDARVRVRPGPAGRFERPGQDRDVDAGLAALVTTAWRVAAASDRRGLRLDGPPLPGSGDASAASQGVLPGTIQVTPSGQPLVLLRDGGTTGGYPVAGVVIAADLWRLGRVRPGGPIEFELIDAESARAAATEHRAWLAAGAQRLRANTPDAWDHLADEAGA